MSGQPPKAAKTARSRVRKGATVLKADDPRVQPDWRTPCISCGAKPTLPLTEMCGPCTFGEAETSGGNW